MKAKSVLGLLPALAVGLALTSGAQAAAVRTFVSSAGNDGNAGANCPRLSPCRNFAAAYAVTLAGGEVVALDAAGYGTLTISGGVTLVGVEGALISVPTGTAGVTVNAGSSYVELRNILITGAGASNTTGVDLNSGRLVIRNSVLKQLSTGLDAAANTKSDVIETDVSFNGTGIRTTGTGGDGQSGTPYGPTQVRISGGGLVDNTTALFMQDPGLRPNPATDNLITIFLHSTDNSSAGVETNISGNATFMSGGGTGCGGQNCQNPGQYSGTTNPH